MVQVFLFVHRNKRTDIDTSVPVCAQEQRDHMIQVFLFVHRNKRPHDTSVPVCAQEQRDDKSVPVCALRKNSVDYDGIYVFTEDKLNLLSVVILIRTILLWLIYIEPESYRV